MRQWVSMLFAVLLPTVGLAKSATLTHEYHLRNGLTLIVREDHRAPVVLSSIWYKVGGSYEHGGITGISHMLEHMMFQGSTQFPKGAIFKLVSEHGGQQNAMTSEDFTAYYQVLPAKDLQLSLAIEADRMRHLLLLPRRYQSEHQVVMEERRMRVDDNPQALTYERFIAAAHVNNPYHHPTIGWMTDVSHLTLDDLKRWYQTWYAPNNAVMVIVGDVSPLTTLKLVTQYFGKIPRGKIPAVKPRKEIENLGRRQVIVNVPAKLPLLIMGYNVPELTTKNIPQWQPYALLVLAGILDAGNSSRLSRDLIRGQQLAASADASYQLYRLYNDLFIFTAVPSNGHTVGQLQRALMNEIHQLQTQLVTTAELNRIKAQVIASNVFQKDSLYQQAVGIGMAEAVGLSWKDDDAFVSRVNAITPVQIQAVANEYLIPKRLTIALLKPEVSIGEPNVKTH